MSSVMQSPGHDGQSAKVGSDFDEYTIPRPSEREPLEILEAQRLWRAFEAKRDVLFDEPKAKLNILETNPRNEFPQNGSALSISELEQVQQHFNQSDQNPVVRHVFIGSNDSRSSMNCSSKMFKVVCAHQQIEPSFLESVFSFGYQPYPIDYCLTQFQSRTSFQMRDSSQLPNSKPADSGQDIHMSYLLRSVERSGPHGIEGWQIRQAANYHSFDLGTGRSFWLTIKANDKLERRIKDSTPHMKILPEGNMEDGNISSCLKASLSTHLLYLSWCDDGWREFINDFEDSIRTLVLPAKSALVDDHIDAKAAPYAVWPEALRQQHKSRTMSYRVSRANTGMNTDSSHQKASVSVKNRLISLGHGFIARFREAKPDMDEEQGVVLADRATNNAKTAADRSLFEHLSGLDPSGSLDKLRIKDIQTLYNRRELLQRSLLVLELNIGVMRDIQSCYGKLKENELKGSKYDAIINSFLSNLMSIMRKLQTRQSQLRSLSTHLSQSIQLYELVLQQRSNQINMVFADTAHQSAKQMNIVADKTSRETASMHVITVVTLIFLPATFVATFFQSGVLHQDDDTGAFSFQGESFRMFSAICGPLTTITMGVWFIVFARLKLRARKQARETMDPLQEVSDILGAKSS